MLPGHFGEGTKERVAIAAERMIPSLLEAGFRKCRIEMATENVGLTQLLNC
jgi:hypothetical protein